MIPEGRECTSCGRWKPASKFNTAAGGKRLRSKCKACINRKRRLSQYNLTDEEYVALLQAQDYRCGICGVLHNTSRGRLCVDHDHESGKVRGMLCFYCNFKLGEWENNRGRFTAYLEGRTIHGDVSVLEKEVDLQQG
jgi:hypothetical protein